MGYRSPSGQPVEVVPASADALALVDWAFGRFGAGDLAEPSVQRVSFLPAGTRCDDVSGWTSSRDGHAEINASVNRRRGT